MRPPNPAQPPHRTALAFTLVLVPGVLAAVLAGLIGYSLAVPAHQAVGSVALGEIAGNRPAYELNTFAADFETALASPDVRRAVGQVVGEGEPVPETVVTRLGDASLLTLALTAGEEQTASEALLAAGRTAYQQVVDQQRDLQQVRARAAQTRLDELSAELERLRQRLEGAPDEQRPAVQALIDQRRQAVGIAVQELSNAEAGLAVAESVSSRIGGTAVVRVGEVRPTGVLPQVLNATAAGLLGGALVGLLLVFLVYRRPARSERRGRPRLRRSETGPAVAGRRRDGRETSDDEVSHPSLTP